jgi:hypothetical protein
MLYLEYETATKQVVQIHETEPTELNEGYAFAISVDIVSTDDLGEEVKRENPFKVGDEFEQTIWINEVDENKNVISYSAIRNNPNAKRLLQENAELKQKNIDLEQAIAELTLLIAQMGGM